MDISRVFQTSSDSISYFFTQGGTGYYIPLYQREYSWDNENIEQLMDDIFSGVFELLNSQDTIHFMGTIIIVMENDVPNNIKPQDPKAIPSRIDNVIDGQQRISTIALLACCLYQKIYELKEKLPQEYQTHELDGLREAVNTYLTNLQELFSFDLMRGSPKRKPIIIRGSLDGWTLNGKEDEHYQSDVSNYLAHFIKAIDSINHQSSCAFPKPNKKSLVEKNIKTIQDFLQKVTNSHENEDADYPPAWDIVKKIDQPEFWSYARQDLVEIVDNCKNVEADSLDITQKLICSLVQLFAFSNYLLKRCCFTVIKPVSQVRAFDMFQSLNATGTPLTAIETFKPLVVNVVDSESEGFKNSTFEKYFTEIENLMKNLQSASQKSKRTNEYLTIFSLTYEGKSVSKQFSNQRKWLMEKFQKFCSATENKAPSLEEKDNFIHQMGDIATYCKNIIYYQSNLRKCLPEIHGIDESKKKLGAFCLLYLRDANHKMAHTILSRFYSISIRKQANLEENEEGNQINSQNEFFTACKVIAAFFTLWRSALPNTGLDNVYRNLLKEKMSWKKGNSQVTVEALKQYLNNILTEKGIREKGNWKNKAINYLRYDNVQKVCRFALFITAHETIIDSSYPGLMKIGTPGSSTSYLEPTQWLSEDFKSIEHIAPQKPRLSPDYEWDSNLYENDDYEQIGNLTLLPTDINASASNKNWIEKWIYYQHLAETDPQKLNNLKNEAKTYGVELKEETIKKLQNTSHKHHILPIVELGRDGKWNRNFVKERTKRICDILWERMDNWLT
jgi:hypothetical protein